jgi:hypothetical protein
VYYVQGFMATDHEDEDWQALHDEIRRAVLRGHPNPERIGCPGTAILQAIASDTLPPSHAAYHHVAECAECLRELTELQSRQSDTHRSADKVRWQRRLMWVSAVVVVMAGLVIVNVWLALQVRHLQQQLTAMQRHTAAAPAPTSSPGLPLRSISLLPGLSRRGGSSQSATVAIPPEPEVLVFLLTHEKDGYSRYEVILQNTDGTTIARAEGMKDVKPQSGGWAVPVSFSSQLFGVGSYILILRGALEDEQMRILQVYDLSVVK